MKRDNRLVARCTAGEKELLAQVAQAMQRTPSDALRILVYEKAQILQIDHIQNEVARLLLANSLAVKGGGENESE